MSSAVSFGTLRHVSASQITTYQRCARKWHFEKVMGFRPPQTGAQGLGTAVHTHVEGYHLEGKEPPADRAGEVARAMLPLLPPRDPANLIESPLSNPDIALSSVKVLGYIDFAVPPKEARFRIYDSKTTKNLKYAKTADELKDNTQLILYAWWGFSKWLDAESADISHVYGVTEGVARGQLVTATVDREHVESRVQTYSATVEEMKAATTVSDPMLISPNFDACNDYGGCPFKERCLQTPEVRLSYLFRKEEGTAMSLKDRLAKSNTSASILPPDAPKPIIPAPAPLEATSITSVPAQPVTSSTTSELILYVDATPTKGQTIDARLEDLISERMTVMLREAKAEHIDAGELGYGKGKIQLAEWFRKNPPKGVVVASSGGLSTLVIEALSPSATLIVRGLR